MLAFFWREVEPVEILPFDWLNAVIRGIRTFIVQASARLGHRVLVLVVHAKPKNGSATHHKDQHQYTGNTTCPLQKLHALILSSRMWT